MMLKRHLNKAQRAQQIVHFEYRLLRVIDCRSNLLSPGGGDTQTQMEGQY